MKTRSFLLKATVVSCLIFLFSITPTMAQKDKNKDNKSKPESGTPAASPTPRRALPDYGPAISSLQFREIGPATMGGRIDDIEAVVSDPRIIYVATAGGGIFKSVNGGTSWTPIFDEEDIPTIGDIAIAPSLVIA